jgi:hypothetical protein
MQASVTSRSFRRTPVFVLAFALVAALACDENAPTETLAGSGGPASGAADEGPGMTPVDASALVIDLPVNQAVSTASPTPAFKINQYGTGPNGVFTIGATGNAETGLIVYTQGLGRAGWFRIQNTANTQPALDVKNIGSGYAVQAIMAGAGGAGLFENTVTGSVRPALTVRSAGAENPAAVVYSTNENSRQPALSVYHPGATALRASGGGKSGSYPTVLIEQEYGSTEFGAVAALQVIGEGKPRNAASFIGNVGVVGTLTKSAGSFRIDHPLDPEGKYLSHSFVESPDMMNVYNGNVTLDAGGRATVQLPEYFEALNRDFRYQLTAVGAPGPNLYIAEGVKQNGFRIAGGRPYAHVSWQVTGVRQDAYADAHRIRVEEDKPRKESLRADQELVARR